MYCAVGVLPLNKKLRKNNVVSSFLECFHFSIYKPKTQNHQLPFGYLFQEIGFLMMVLDLSSLFLSHQLCYIYPVLSSSCNPFVCRSFIFSLCLSIRHRKIPFYSNICYASSMSKQKFVETTRCSAQNCVRCVCAAAYTSLVERFLIILWLWHCVTKRTSICLMIVKVHFNETGFWK